MKLLLTLLAGAALQACTSAPPPVVVPVPAPPPPALIVPQPQPQPLPPPPATEAAGPPLAPPIEARPDTGPDPRTLCDGRAEGARVQMVGPRGEAISGVCRRGANGWLQFSAQRRP